MKIKVDLVKVIIIPFHWKNFLCFFLHFIHDVLFQSNFFQSHSNYTPMTFRTQRMKQSMIFPRKPLHFISNEYNDILPLLTHLQTFQIFWSNIELGVIFKLNQNTWLIGFFCGMMTVIVHFDLGQTKSASLKISSRASVLNFFFLCFLTIYKHYFFFFLIA